MRTRTHLFGLAVRVGRKVYERATWQGQRESGVFQVGTARLARKSVRPHAAELGLGTSQTTNPHFYSPFWIEQNSMPPPVKHGGEPSIWQKSKCNPSPLLSPNSNLVSDDVSVSPLAPSEVCLIFIVSFSPPGSSKCDINLLWKTLLG
jgi:hypothetical protein